MAIVTGAASGLGALIAKELYDKHLYDVISLDASYPQDSGFGLIRGSKATYRVDVRDRDSCNEVAMKMETGGRVDVLVNCAGVNRIDMMDDVTEEDWDLVMNVNVKGAFNMVQAFHAGLRAQKGTVLNIVSNASHMPMTASAAYNASKGAAHILTLQMARELAPEGITVFGVSPNKLAGTGMSEYIEERVPEVRGWTSDYARQYQEKALLAGEETNPKVLAEFIGFILSTKERHKYLTGCVLPYGA